jgi:hypothetical protein
MHPYQPPHTIHDYLFNLHSSNLMLLQLRGQWTLSSISNNKLGLLLTPQCRLRHNLRVDHHVFNPRNRVSGYRHSCYSTNAIPLIANGMYWPQSNFGPMQHAYSLPSMAINVVDPLHIQKRNVQHDRKSQPVSSSLYVNNSYLSVSLGTRFPPRGHLHRCRSGSCTGTCVSKLCRVRCVIADGRAPRGYITR